MAVTVAAGGRADGAVERPGLVEAAILACSALPSEHWREVYSSHLRERPNQELKRHRPVVGGFPDRTVVRRLLGTVLAAENDEWRVGRRYLGEASRRNLMTARRAARWRCQRPRPQPHRWLPHHVQGHEPATTLLRLDRRSTFWAPALTLETRRSVSEVELPIG